MNFHWLTIGYIGFIVFVIVAADMGSLGVVVYWIHSIPYGDKFGHFILVGVLSFMVNMSLGATRWQWLGWSVLKGSFIIFILITLEEFSQLYFPSRHFDMGDLLSNYLGILLLGHCAIYLSPTKIQEIN
ncbi:MAG: VanZ family protein [Thiotrichaceae bacterium]